MRIKAMQKIIDKIRCKKNKVNEYNLINNIGNNIIEYDKNDEKFFDFNIVGNNNKIIIKKLSNTNLGKLIINLYGDDNEIFIDENLFIGTKLFILLGQNHPFQGKIYNSKFIMGKNCRVEEASSTQYNSNTKTMIGRNCLISLNVKFYNTDGHPIYNYDDNKLCNYVRDIEIGENSWIGYNATILKNVSLAENTIVGWGAVVSKSFKEKNVAIAGNPAKIVKSNLSWKISDKEYIENNLEELK